MRFLKRYITFIVTATIFSQDFSGEIAIIGQLPQGEFKEEGVPTGIGFDINGMYYPVKELGFGLNLGGSIYGYSERKIPFNYYTDLVTITEKTSNNIAHGHIFFRIMPFQGNITPYFEGLVGLKNLSTTTELVNESCDDNDATEYDDCQIAESTNASDTALSYGVGAGLEIKLGALGYDDSDMEDNLIGDLSFFVNGRYLWGREAKYLKDEENSIVFTNPQDGPVETIFNWSESKTDLLQISVGVSIKFSL